MEKRVRKAYFSVNHTQLALTTSYQGVLSTLGRADKFLVVTEFEIINDSGNTIYLSFDGANDYLEIKAGEIYSFDVDDYENAMFYDGTKVNQIKDIYLKGASGSENYRLIIAGVIA